MPRRAALPLLVLLAAPLAAAPPMNAQRRVEPADVLATVDVTDPRISPDGRWIAVVRRAVEDGHSTSSLWLVARADGAARRISPPDESASSPRWAPDGSSLAFLAGSAGGAPRIYLYVLAQGIAGPLPADTGGATELAWSPDGGRIAFTRTAAADEAADDPVVVGEPRGQRPLWTLALASGQARRLSPPDATVWRFAWAPDGRSIAALVSATPDAEGQEYQSRLTLLDAATGAGRQLAERTQAQAAPSFSADGRWIAYLGPVGDFKERGIPYVVPAAGGTPRPLLADYPGNVWDLAWHPREPRLLVGLAAGTEHALASLDLEGHLTRLVTVYHSLIPYWNPVWSVSADGTALAYVSEPPGVGPELWTAALDGTGERRLTRWNEALEERALGPVEPLRWQSAGDGATVEGILVRPPGATDRPLPLLVWLHGGPAYNWGVGAHLGSWAQLFAAQGYLVLLPNFRGSSGYGMGWMTANVRDWGEGPFGDLLGGVDRLVAEGQADPHRLFVGGGSYGGFLTYWTIAHSDRFRAAWVRAGVSDIAFEYALTDEPSFLVGYFGASPYDDPEVYRRTSPITYAERVQTPLLIVSGERDLRVPLPLSRLFYDAVVRRGVPVQLVIYPREGHGIREPEHQLDNMRRAIDWFARWDPGPSRER